MRGLKLDDFELGGVLGVGTVGTVHQSIMKSTGEVVAVKILHQAMGEDPVVRSRFEREMAILQRLSHPNIIRYYGGGNQNGKLFFAMELVNGGSIKDLLQHYDRITWQEVVATCRQVCSALQHAHNHGIIHRDLKPANLFLMRDGRVKLGDFGIARDTHSADITVEGYTVGTHAYMSPEQITGETSITGKADLYSLGCVLFEMLTGRTPFVGANFAQLFEQHLRQKAPSVRDLIGDCPVELDRQIGQLLEKDPEKRPFNARAVQASMMQIAEKYDLLKPASAEPITPAAGKKDVAASAAVALDLGQSMLSRRLNQETISREIPWVRVLLLAITIIIVVAVASLLGQ